MLVASLLTYLGTPPPEHLWPTSLGDEWLPELVQMLRTTIADRRERESGRLLIVVDDVEDQDGVVITRLAELHRLLCSFDVCFLVTTRSLRVTSDPSFCHALVLGKSDLALSGIEASALFALAGPQDDPDSCETALDACSGHIALFCVLVRSSGSDRCRTEAESVRRWLVRMCDRDLLPEHLLVLRTMALLRHGTSDDLAAIGLKQVDTAIASASNLLPLVRIARDEHAVTGFTVHDLAREWLLLDGDVEWAPPADILAGVLSRLVTRGDYARAALLVQQHETSDGRLGFVRLHGDAMLSEMHFAELDGLLSLLAVHCLMQDQHLLLLWAQTAYELGQADDAAARAKAALEIARYAGDAPTVGSATAVAAASLDHAERHDEAWTLVDSVLNEFGNRLDAPTRFGLHLNCVRLCMATGLADRAHEHLREAESAVVTPGEADAVTVVASAFQAICYGEFRLCAHNLAARLPMATQPPTFRALSAGILSFCLLEAGRLERAKQLAASAAEFRSPVVAAAYRPVLGATQWAAGERTEGEAEVLAGMELCAKLGMEGDLAGDRPLYSMLLRTEGELDEALAQAERGYSRLSGHDSYWFRRLAAIEVAASLLALGDIEAARRWAANVATAGFGENRYHAFRAAMVLAECDRRDGNLAAGIELLAEHVDQVRSENSNFQAAMYCRAFPELLGMIAAAVGSAHIPVHMLRMVPPEYAERSLRASVDWLDAGEWALLGERLLGAEQFAAYVQRRGEPICRARLFGGLEVVVDDRVIRERNWKKRKSRLLFAMLVANSGQDLPRDQVLETLWPDLSEANARNNFYVAWSAMKFALTGSTNRDTPCPYVESIRGRCRIVRDALRSDIDEFEETIAEGRKAEADGDAPTAIAAYKRLAGIYRGDLLPGDVYDDWFAPMRDRYRFDFVDAMLHTVELLLELDDPCDAIVYARRGLQADPCREDLYQALLRCHVAAGQRSAAVETFVQCKTNLAEELGLDPSAETLALYQSVLVMEDRPRRDTFGLT